MLHGLYLASSGTAANPDVSAGSAVAVNAGPQFFACLGRFESCSVPTTLPPCYAVYPLGGRHHGGYYTVAEWVTFGVPAVADAEIVLEGELLPIGWTQDEGPFGEFAGMYGDLKANPVFKVTAITHRRDAIFQLLQMPWENAWLGAAATEAQVWNVLKTAGVDVVNVAVTEGSACPSS